VRVLVAAALVEVFVTVSLLRALAG